MVAIIDYGAGNLSSVKKALDFLGADNKITMDKNEILSASHVILPGVGSYGDAVISMRSKGIDDTVRIAAKSGKPFLGICLGLQLLFDGSEESPGVSGLGLLSGVISKIPNNSELKVPHVGWNSVSVKKTDGLFSNISNESYFYFVHSYYLHGAPKEIVAGKTDYGVPIECAVQQGNLWATQFHPEKSSEAGLKLLKNFLALEG